jgi:EmrB/QacA subfamily drug resistance transporter
MSNTPTAAPLSPSHPDGRAQPAPAAEANPERWKALAAICIPIIMTSIDATILNVALPTIARSLHATSAQLVWINSAYIIMFGSTILLSANLADKYGRKGVLMLGMTVFILGSIWAGLSTSPYELVAARLVQGIGGGLVMPATLSLITSIFLDPAERAKAIGTWAGMSGIGVAVGPILGGLLLTFAYWGSVFFINVPVVIIGLFLVSHYVPTSKTPNAPPLDVLGALLSLCGLFAVFFYLIEAPERGWGDPLTLGMLVLGLVLLVGFVVRELSTPYPMLDVRLFKKPAFTSSNIAVAIAFFALFGLLYELTLYLQAVRDDPPLKAGFALVPFAIMLLVGAPAAPRYVAQFGLRRVIVLGLLLAGLGMLTFFFVSVTAAYVLILSGLVLVGLGVAITVSPTANAVMGDVPREQAGMGAGSNTAFRQIGSSLGIAIIGGIGQTVYLSQLSSSSVLQGLTSAEVTSATGSITGAQAVAQQLGAQGAALQTTANAAFVLGMHVAMMVAFVIAVLGAFYASRAVPATKLDAAEHMAAAPA